MDLRVLLLERYAVMRDLREPSVRKHLYTLDRFKELLAATFPGRNPEPTLSDLDDLLVMRFLRWRAQTIHHGRLPSQSTVSKDRDNLLALATFAAKKRMRPSPAEEPIEFLVLPNRPPVLKIPVAYTIEEITRLVQLARTREGTAGGQPAGWFWSTLIQAGFATGERIGALLGLRWREVDTASGMLTFLAATRKGRQRDIQRGITAELAAELEPRRQGDGELVWDWCRDRDYHSLWPSMRLLCQRSGIRITGFHALRKASASYIAAAGGNAQEHLSHASPAMTRDHYLDPRITGRQSGLEFLPRLELEPVPNLSSPPERRPPPPPQS